MEERSVTIPEFPDYDITDWGRVFNNRTGREMVLSPNQLGELTVGLVSHKKQYRRSVKLLVASAFVPGETLIFDTPILLDNNRENLHYLNIEWRPRWFAWRYCRQFSEVYDWYYVGPIREITENRLYPNIIEAAIENGLLAADIKRMIYHQSNRTSLFPTGQIFEYI
jgi:hypothetical protein